MRSLVFAGVAPMKLAISLLGETIPLLQQLRLPCAAKRVEGIGGNDQTY
jgi:hypothetical protein